MEVIKRSKQFDYLESLILHDLLLEKDVLIDNVGDFAFFINEL